MNKKRKEKMNKILTMKQQNKMRKMMRGRKQGCQVVIFNTLYNEDLLHNRNHSFTLIIRQVPNENCCNYI